MKNKIIKTASVILAVLLTCTCTAVIAYSAGADDSKSQKEPAAAGQKTGDTYSPVSKDETVYVLANADGSVKKIIVSDWIKNKHGAKEVADRSDLANVTNVKGNESYSMNSDNMRVWNADGSDIYSQGETDKALPVDLSVIYKLDGKTISAESLAGKSGRVSIRFDYKNNEYETVSIDGKDEKIYVPFLMLTGSLFDNEKFKNIEVSNGKLINDGSHTAVVGIALPGMQTNLALGADKFEIPEYIEITADVTDFSMNTTLTLATNELFSAIDMSNFNKIDELKSKMTLLTDSMNQLLDGSSKLYSGTAVLLEKSNIIIEGIDTLISKSGEINDNMQLISAGLTGLVSNNEALVGGAKETFKMLLSAVNSTFAGKGIPVAPLTEDNYDDLLTKLAESPDEAQKTALISSADTEISANLTEVPDEYKVAAKVLLADMTAGGMSTEEASSEVKRLMTDLAKVGAILSSGMTPDTNVSAYLSSIGYDAATARKAAVICNYMATVSGGAATDYIAAAGVMLENAGKVTAAQEDTNGQQKICALCLGLAEKTVTDTKTQLDSYQEFYIGLQGYTAGVATVSDGASKLADGTKAFNEGMKNLKNGYSALQGGISELLSGTMQLSEGLKMFNSEGIAKISELTNGELCGIVTRLKATVDVSKKYNSFAGIADNATGNVRFIYKTDEIK